MNNVDELFGEGAGAPKPRTVLIVSLLVGGLLLSFLGLACCTTAPGGAIVLVAWAVVEKEMSRVESGYLPEEFRRYVGRLRLFTWASVLVVIGLFVTQLILLAVGAYDELWFAALEMMRTPVEPIVIP